MKGNGIKPVDLVNEKCLKILLFYQATLPRLGPCFTAFHENSLIIKVTGAAQLSCQLV